MIPQQLERPTVEPPLSAASDADLLRAIGEGSEPAFEELRQRYRRAVERACRAIVGGELEDCAQEVFVRIGARPPCTTPVAGARQPGC